MVVAAPKKPIHPALLELGEGRARSVQNRVADAITRFAGSMWFAYLHIAWFSIWIALGIERYPYGLLTMIVSLEAIFLSTFVMISQNRQDDARRHLADQEWRMVRSEEQTMSDPATRLITAIGAGNTSRSAARSASASKDRELEPIGCIPSAGRLLEHGALRGTCHTSQISEWSSPERGQLKTVPTSPWAGGGTMSRDTCERCPEISQKVDLGGRYSNKLQQMKEHFRELALP